MTDNPTNETGIQIIKDTPAMQIQEPTRRVLGNLIRRTIFDLTADEMKRLQLMANMYAASSFNNNGKQTEGDFFLMMMKGLELGIAPMAAVDTINIIQGKPTLDAKGMLAIVKSSGLLENIDIDSDKNRCIVTLKRKGQTEQIVSFSMEEAQQFKTTKYVNKQPQTISLAEKDNWKSQPEVMLKWRAVTKAMREVFPDVLAGLYTQEELAPDNTIVHADGSMELSDEILKFGVPPTLGEEDIAKILEWTIGRNYGFETADEILSFINKPDWEFVQGADLKELGANACKLIAGEHTKFVNKVLGWSNQNEYGSNAEEILKLIGEENWAFAKGNFDTASNRIKAAHEALAAELNNKSDDATDNDDNSSDEPPVPTWTFSDSETFRTYIKKWYDKTMDDIVTEYPENVFPHDLAVNFASAGQAINRVNQLAAQNQWDVVVNSFEVVAMKNGGKVVFTAPFGKIVIFSREAFEKLVGKEYGSNNEMDIANLDPGTYENLDHMKISWEQQKSNKVLTGAVEFDPYDVQIPM